MQSFAELDQWLNILAYLVQSLTRRELQHTNDLTYRAVATCENRNDGCHYLLT